MRERVVEKHLHAQVTAAGGTTRKMGGRKNNCDRVVIWPSINCASGVKSFRPGGAITHYVETKAPGKKARAGQLREHQRLRNLGCAVYVLDTKQKVDAYIYQELVCRLER